MCLRLAVFIVAVTGFGDLMAQGEQGLPGSGRIQDAEQSELITLGSIRISEIRVEGSSVFSEEELAEFVEPYVSRSVTFEELQGLRQTISAQYLDRGYVNSGVVIPDQRVENGVVVLRAVEGGLTEIDVQGNRGLRERAIARRVERHLSGGPLDINELQESLRILQQDPLVQQVNAALLPGDAPGESYLRLGITERPRLDLQVSASTFNSLQNLRLL